ncbi:MAG: peptidylprolyl isomerase [Halioglobus sp.]
MTFLAWFNRPWLHFLVLGILLFLLQGALFPEPKPVVGPLAPERLENMLQQWVATTGRPPTTEQRQRLVQSELDRDMLFQRALEFELHLHDTVVYQRLLRNMRFLGLGEGESDQALYEQALEMRLHLGDEVVKRRMVQVMEQLLLASYPPASVTQEQVRAEFESRTQDLRRPQRLSIEHIYFARPREAEAENVIASIEQEQLTPRQARELSSPFLPGYQFDYQSPDQLARHFGAAFVKNLLEAEPQPRQWVGPIRSTYGLHYVWVEAIEPARDATFDEVRGPLRRDLESTARADALAAAIENMRELYEVRL